MEKELIFWKDMSENESFQPMKGGYFVKSDLKDFLNVLIKSGREPIGIKVDLENYNLEVIVKDNDDK